jgi:hypothetical protein
MSLALIAVEHRKTAHIVSVHTTYDDALTAWYAADDARIAASTPMQEMFYAVRDPEDPRDPTVALLHQPQPEKPKRRQTRRVPGTDVVMVNEGDHRWVSEDGEYVIERVDDYETECDAEHPVRIGRPLREQFAQAQRAGTDHLWQSDLRRAIKEGRKGYQCPGCETHFYSMWEVGSKHGYELISRDDAFGDALHYLGEHLKTGKIFV